MPSHDRSSGVHGIASRVRELVFASSSAQFASIARRLRVGELALRRTVHTSTPSPDPEVLAAVVKEYGVDPTWLITGEYDAVTHARAVETSTRASLVGRFRVMLAARRRREIDESEETKGF